MLGNQEILREGSTVLPFLTGDHAAIYRQDLWAEVAGQQRCSCLKWIPAVCTEHDIPNIPGHQQCLARQPGSRASTSLSQSQHPSPLLWALLSVLVTSLVTVDKCSTRKQWRLERPLLVQCLWDYSLLWQGKHGAADHIMAAVGRHRDGAGTQLVPSFHPFYSVWDPRSWQKAPHSG